jgi:tetratricopeptide (TPR) repeat protein
MVLLGLLFTCLSGAAAEPLREFAPLQLTGLEAAVAEKLRQAQATFDPQPLAIPKQPEQRQRLAQRYGEIGHLYHAHELWAWAETAYSNAQQLDPQDPTWRHAASVVEFKRGNLTDATAGFEALLEVAPGHEASRYYLIEIALQQGRAEHALQHARTIRAPEAIAWGLVATGRALQSLGRHQEAAQRFTEALVLTPEANRLHYLLGMALRSSGDMSQAHDHLTRAGSVGLHLPDPLNALLSASRAGVRGLLQEAERAMRAGRPQDAQRTYHDALAEDPGLAEAHAGLAVAQAALGEINAARDSLLRALQIEPSLDSARRNLARTELHLGNLDGAISQLQILLRSAPAEPALLHLLGAAQLAKGETAAGEASLQQALSLAPRDADLRFDLASHLVNTGQLNQARDVLSDGLQLDSQALALRRALSRILAAAPQVAVRDGARAVALIEPLASQSGLPADVLLLALAFGESGRCKDAAAAYQQLADSDPARAPHWSERARAAELGDCRPALP